MSHSDPSIDYNSESYTQQMIKGSRRVMGGIIFCLVGYFALLFADVLPSAVSGHHPQAKQHHADDHGEEHVHADGHHDDHHSDHHASTDHHNDHHADGHDDEHGKATAKLAGFSGDSHGEHHDEHGAHGTGYVPPFWAVLPFAALLLSIALLPLIPATEHWWHSNKNRFIVAVSLGTITLFYYGFVHHGGIDNHFTHEHAVAAGLPTVFAAFCNAMFVEFIPFIVLLFSLYVISGGINLRGDLPAKPSTNCIFIGIGTALASFIGTTGAAMVLIRPLLTTNQERKFKVHTVVFFIFMVCNCGGLLLPIGDPPLFLGYLRGVPFEWTLQLWPYWLGVNLLLLAVYWVWDTRAYAKEDIKDIQRDDTEVQPLELNGKINILFLFGVVLCVAFVTPGKEFLSTGWVPAVYFRECLMLIMVLLSLYCTSVGWRVNNRFDYVAIVEVAALFCGIFVCMQVPIEILNIHGAQMGVDSPQKFFWATGILSSFLDNAPTYVVFFETAKTMPIDAGAATLDVGSGLIMERFLIPISLGAVLMGANTYIGNGPNFMVKAIAEQAGISMPSFFGYMLYSTAILIPAFILVSFVMGAML